MNAYTINVQRHTERLSAFVAGWQAPFPFNAVCAVDGSACKAPQRWQHSPGAYGLYVTYLYLFADILRTEQSSPFAIFEDDALLAPDWWTYASAAIAEAPPDWWMINLGADIEVPGFEAPPVPLGPHLARMPHGWRTHAVLYNPVAIPELLAALCANAVPVDQVWCDLMLKGSRDFYCTRAMLAGSRAGTSTITGIEWAQDFTGPHGIGEAQHTALLL